MSEARKLAAILVADIVGYSRLAGADEDRTLARLRALRSDLIDPTIAVHHGRIVKRTGDGIIVEFRSVVDAVRCSIEVQSGMLERNAGLPPERRIEFRVGIHLGDVVEESDGDLMGDGVNIAARLEGVAEPGGIYLSSAAYEQVRDKIREEFVDLGDKELKNIARPVRVYALGATSRTPSPGPLASALEKLAPRLSIVVLQFANIGGVPEQDYFVDGVTESLTTDLSRISGSFVIARNTAFSYKGKPLDVRKIGRELNVRYVLEGSVQRGGNRMRVNTQLIDAGSGNHLWAERFEKPLADLFDMQDEIVARLANTLNAQLVTAEARRAERSSNPDSMDLYFQGMAWFNKGLTPDPMAKARHYFERALALDPGNIDALAFMGAADALAATSFSFEDRAEHLNAAEAAAVKALSLASDHAWAHVCMGIVMTLRSRPLAAIAELERALSLDRNLAWAHAAIGLAKFTLGKGDETESHMREAFRLSPRDPWSAQWHAMIGAADIFLAKDEQAVASLRRSIEANRNYSPAHLNLAAALAHLGRLDEARIAVQSGLTIDPKASIARVRAAALSNNPNYLTQRERLYEGMRKAGVPEA
jgi:TolB-like protein/class 3 adenylate cyclase